MRCIRCGSRRLIEFVDGFGEERIFCRDCFLSLNKNYFIKSYTNTGFSKGFHRIFHFNKTWNIRR